MWSDIWGQMLWGGSSAVPLLGPMGLVALVASFLVGGYVMQTRERLGFFSTLGIVVVLVAPLGAFALATLPHSFVNGQVADADEVNANFEALETAVNHRSIERISGNGPPEGIDAGLLSTRVLSVTKARADTSLRISYTDHFRVRAATGTQASCSWEIVVDGVSCTGGALSYRIFNNNFVAGSDHYRPATIVGYCDGLAAGAHDIEIQVDDSQYGFGSSSNDCSTGWSTEAWMIEAEEVY